MCSRDHGRVVWGFLVQANQVLFDPSNSGVRPAVLLYSPDTYFDDNVEVLAELAAGLFELKGSSTGNPEIDQFVSAITNEMARTDRLPLPPRCATASWPTSPLSWSSPRICREIVWPKAFFRSSFAPSGPTR